MRASLLMLVLMAGPGLGGSLAAHASGAPPASPAVPGDPAPALAAPARAPAFTAKQKGRGKGKGEADSPGTVPRTGPRPGKPPRPVMARHPLRRSPSPVHADAPPAHLLRSGFRVTTAGSEVVLQTSAEVGLETRGTKAAPSFVLRRCRALRANDRRPLDTRYFGTAVTGVALHQRGRDLVVQVMLREPAIATPRKEPGPGQTWSWILAFASTRESEPPKSNPPPSAPTATAAMIR